MGEVDLQRLGEDVFYKPKAYRKFKTKFDLPRILNETSL
jgi:hypothetical protein